MTLDQPSKPPNGMNQLLSTLAQSSNQWVQLGTLAMVGLAGLGNWAATWNSADRNKNEIEISRRVAWEGEQRVRAEVIKQVQEIHNWMQEATEEFHRGNADSAANRKTLEELKKELEDLQKKQ
jgi:hypothetical protein